MATHQRVVTLARLSRRGKLRRVDALEGMSFCSTLRFPVRAGGSLRTEVRNHRRVEKKVQISVYAGGFARLSSDNWTVVNGRLGNRADPMTGSRVQ